MAQESRLAVTIDSRGAKRSADDLAGSLERMERAGDAAAASADGVSSSLDDQRKELSQLLGQINPTVAALGRLDDMQEKLAKFKKAGVVESDTFVEYTQRINTMRDALGESTASMNKAGMSAKAYQAALRGVPAQFTDIAVSLQGGQAPLTVLLQQGGQLKDMFGGIGPAAKALGGYVLGLVNPFTVAAAAAGALGVAYYRGSEQSDALRNSLILTGNFSKASEAQLIDLAESADQVTGTFGQSFNASTTNKPLWIVAGSILTMSRGPGEASQIAISSATRGGIGIRFKEGGVWRAWANTMPLGIGQTYTKVTRLRDVTYTNDTGRAIILSFACVAGADGMLIQLFITGTGDGTVYSGHATGAGRVISLVATIPAGANYVLTANQPGAFIGPDVSELR